jgi:long-chain fatty acid transport protein
LGIRHRFDERWTVMGTAEWMNWSRIGTVNFTTPSGGPATIGTTAGPTLVALPFQYRDGWFFSGGAEYQWSERLALRSGIAFERSPVTDQVRMPAIPDNDRFWLSVGASWQIFPGVMWFDLAYSHIWVKDPSINITASSGNPWFNGFSYVGDVDAHVDIFSASLVWRFGAAQAPKKALITK